MKNSLFIIAIFLGLAIGQAHAQDFGKASDALKQQMQRLSYFAGKWKGEAVARERDGSTTKIIQEENIEFRLDNTLLLIEGTGRNPENLNEITFHALAVVNYDEAAKAFKFRSHLRDGKMTDAYFNILADNHFAWGFDLPGTAKMHYDIKLDPKNKSWHEVGEYSPDSVTWYKFIELKLTKLN